MQKNDLVTTLLDLGGQMEPARAIKMSLSEVEDLYDNLSSADGDNEGFMSLLSEASSKASRKGSRIFVVIEVTD